ncbi:hypothetical protein H0H81_009130 [Sphagnurus paluster]|uniref:Uncharacterized protein n=1 Tax=Sphagnurus paluster TaxID=117069 RepID=A0A9P7GL55_9AGAR|nr:hypothetical protein H0H81_009130 [Sphagnurus paluster]
MSSSDYHTPSQSATESSQNDTRVSTVGILLTVVGVLLIAGVVFMTLHMKRRRCPNNVNGANSFTSPPLGRVLESSHPAARISPFGSPGPRFRTPAQTLFGNFSSVNLLLEHTPGSEMRIALRRPDGAWEFADPQTPFTSSGISAPEALHSPSIASMLSPKARKKDYETYGYDRDYDFDLSPPPPAYGHDYSGYDYSGQAPQVKH